MYWPPLSFYLSLGYCENVATTPMSVSTTCQLRAYLCGNVELARWLSVSTKHIHIGSGTSIPDLAPILPVPSYIRTASRSWTNLLGRRCAYYLYCSYSENARPLTLNNCVFVVFRLKPNGTYLVNMTSDDEAAANNVVDRFLYMQYQQTPVSICHMAHNYSQVLISPPRHVKSYREVI